MITIEQVSKKVKSANGKSLTIASDRSVNMVVTKKISYDPLSGEYQFYIRNRVTRIRHAVYSRNAAAIMRRYNESQIIEL